MSHPFHRLPLAAIASLLVACQTAGPRFSVDQEVQLAQDTIEDLQLEVNWPPAPFKCPSAESLTVAVGYTPAALKHQPSVVTMVSGAATQLNDALKLSGVSATFAFTAFNALENEAGNIVDDLKALATKDGKWDPLLVRPEDLVVLLVTKSTAKGRATVGATPGRRYAVVNVDAIKERTVSHEIGHLAGARHELENDPANTPFSYGHGHWVANQFTTIMAVGGSWCGNNCPRINYFANPSVSYGTSPPIPTGTAANSDVVRVLTKSLPYLSSLSCYYN